jgi:hypothetical protein
LADDDQAQAATDDAAAQAAAADTTQQDTSTDSTSADTAATGDSDQVKALRQEAASRRKELRDAQAELKKFQDAQLSETEKLTKRAAESEAKVAELEQKARAATLRAEITTAAAAAGVTDVQDATLLLPSVGQVEYDDDGEPTNVAELVAKLVEAKPYLLGQQDDQAQQRDPRTQRTAPATSRRSGGKFSLQQVQAMTPEQIRTLSPEDHAAVMAALAG